jgi:hypothetical protein
MVHLFDRPQSKYGRVHKVGPIFKKKRKDRISIGSNCSIHLEDLQDVVARKIQYFLPHHEVYTSAPLVIIELYVPVYLSQEKKIDFAMKIFEQTSSLIISCLVW